MAVKNLSGRQRAKAAYVEVTAADFVAGGGVVDLKVPTNSELVVGHINVVEAFDGVTTDTLAVGDTASAARYLAATSIKATGRTALVPTGFIHGDSAGSNTTIRLTRATTGGAAQAVGKVRVYFATVKLGRAESDEG